ncbi:MAG: nitrous oxide reductase family maturation protein NosD [Methanotrichaceae archaeon]
MKRGVCWLAFAIILMITYSAGATVIKVQPGTSIQATLDRAEAGDIIEVQGGIYRESLNITKQIILRGEDMPLLDSGAIGSAITLQADGIVVSGFDIRSTRRTGISVKSNDSVINKNNISYCTDGIRLEGARNCTIFLNVISNNTNGISLASSEHNVIAGNYIKDNNIGESKDCGIFLLRSNYNTISKNDLIQNGDSSISLRSSSNNTIDDNNISKSDWYGISLEESSNDNAVLHNSAFDNGHGGISLDSSKRNAIRDNIAENNERGIYLAFDSNDNSLERNNLSLNDKGIHLAYHSSNNTITKNIVVKNTYGIYLAFSAGWNKIFSNYLIDNSYNAYDLGLRNNWDNGVTGNYYSDLGCVVYIPGGSGVDRHPLGIGSGGITYDYDFIT